MPPGCSQSWHELRKGKAFGKTITILGPHAYAFVPQQVCKRGLLRGRDLMIARANDNKGILSNDFYAVFLPHMIKVPPYGNGMSLWSEQ